MGYADIPNLYKDQSVLLFKEVWATEKIHGTTAWVVYDRKQYQEHLHYHPGGSKMEFFTPLFDEPKLLSILDETFLGKVVTIHGENYGGKINGGRKNYGDYGFIVFEIQVDDCWLSFDVVQRICERLGLDVVDGVIVPATVDALDHERDRPSVLAMKRGVGDNILREGIVIRPLIELTKNNGERVMAKHKGDAFKETASHRDVSPDKLEVLKEAEAIAFEWVTPMRLVHVLDAYPNADVKDTGNIIRAMQEDIEKESKDEIEWSVDARKAIGQRTAKIFKEYLHGKIVE